MAITKLVSFEAEAEVLGRLHTVQWTGESLVIQGVDLADAKRILRELSADTIVAAELPGEEARPVPAKNGSNGFNGHASSHEVFTAAVETKPEAPKANAEAPSPAPAKPVNMAELEAQFETQFAASAPVPVAKVPAFKPQPAAPRDPVVVGELPAWAGGDAPEVPENVRQAGKLGDVLMHLISQGMTTTDTLVAECARIRESVPVLRVVANLDDRVRRAVEALKAKGVQVG